jgi:hypothetical protein
MPIFFRTLRPDKSGINFENVFLIQKQKNPPGFLPGGFFCGYQRFITRAG